MGYSCFYHPNPAEATPNAVALMELGRDLGCPLQRVFIGTPKEPFDPDEALASTAANLKGAARYAEDIGIKIAIETHDAWLTGPRMKRLVEEVNSPNVGVCFDVGNSYHFGHPLEETFAAIKPYIWHVHFKDSLGPGSRNRLPLIGRGEVDLYGAAQLLEASGYSGYYSCEWEKKWHPELEEPEIAFPDYIKFCRALEKKLDAASGGEKAS
jgi:sugar phosphate isomerase/epimerase